MGIFKRRVPCASPETLARLKLAERDLAEQKKRREKERKHQQELEGALARNHLAQLMFEALSSKRGEASS